MATLKSIRKSILSVKNTQKITKAMKMVAAAKLRRAQNALMGARPHSEFLSASLKRLLAAAEITEHPLMNGPDKPKKAHVLVLSSDRGLCGGFNGNLLRFVDHWTSHEGKTYEEIQLSTLGRKGRDYYKAKKIELDSAEVWPETTFDFAKASEMVALWQQRFEAGEFDAFYLAFNSFKSAIAQVPTLHQVFPLSLTDSQASDEDNAHQGGESVAWEGKPEDLVEQLITRRITTLFYLAVLESQASELGARMSAMDNATNNANEMLGSLTLQYNRARQAAITTELMDIVNGAEALG